VPWQVTPGQGIFTAMATKALSAKTPLFKKQKAGRQKMRFLKFNMRFVALFCVVGIATQAAAATTQTSTLPHTITTQEGKTYRSVQLVSTDPDGLVIQFRPQEGGIGMAKLKFRNLPEQLRQDFNYNENAAAEFESANAQALVEWREALQNAETQPAQTREQALAGPSSDSADSMVEQFPTGRFRAVGTIRGAMILDSITGQAWMVDLHSVLTDYHQDRSFFLQPKVLLPDREPQRTVFIGP
jgi:hypothetical protein